MTIEYIVGTALAAFAASLAAVAVSALLDRAARRRSAKSAMLLAIQRHQERLWLYANQHLNSRIIGIANKQTMDGQFAPRKPPTAILVSDMQSQIHYFGTSGRIAAIEAIEEARKSEVQAEDPSKLAEWQSESFQVQTVAVRLALWDGKSDVLPSMS